MQFNAHLVEEGRKDVLLQVRSNLLISRFFEFFFLIGIGGKTGFNIPRSLWFSFKEEVRKFTPLKH